METNPTSFPDNFLEISITATYKQGGQTLAESSKKLQVVDDDDPKYRLRWRGAKEKNAVTKLVDKKHPDVAYHPSPKGYPAVLIQTNQWPPAQSHVNVAANTNLAVGNGTACLFIHYGLDGSGETLRGKALERYNKTQQDLDKQKTLNQFLSVNKDPQKHISKLQHIRVSIPSPPKLGKLDAHLFSSKDAAVKFLNPEVQPAPTTNPDPPKTLTAYVGERAGNSLSVYAVIQIENVNQGNNCELTLIGSKQNTLSDFKNASKTPGEVTKIKKELEDLPAFKSLTKDKEFKPKIYDSEKFDQEDPTKVLTAVVLTNHVVIQCKLGIEKKASHVGKTIYEKLEARDSLEACIKALTEPKGAQTNNRNTKPLLEELDIRVDHLALAKYVDLIKGHNPGKPQERFLKPDAKWGDIWSSFINLEKANLPKLEFSKFEEHMKKYTVANSLRRRKPIQTDDDNKPKKDQPENYTSDDKFRNFAKKCFAKLKTRSEAKILAFKYLEDIEIDLEKQLKVDIYNPKKERTIPLKFKLKFN